MALEISEMKLLKHLMRISDDYYKFLDLTTCLKSFNKILENPITASRLMNIEYHRGLIYPLFPLDDKYRFYKFEYTNRRMSELLDWHCEKGNIRHLLQQISADILNQCEVESELLCKFNKIICRKYI